MNPIESALVSTGAPLVVAEVAQAHDGSLGTAHAFIDAVAQTGADAVKFQTHIAEAESSEREPWRVVFSSQDASRYAYWKRTGFSKEQWVELKAHADEKDLIFLSSPFSMKAVEWLQEMDIPAWKIASGEVGNLLLLDAMMATGKPLLLSSGMSSWQELDGAVERIRAAGNPFLLMQCTTAYPCPPEVWGLNVMREMQNRYDCPVGFSDHSGTLYPGMAAVTLGARLIEVHVTLSRQAFGPDVPASLTPEELTRLVEGVRAVATALQHPVNKDAIAREKEELRRNFGQSLVAAATLPHGTRLERVHLSSRKPLDGIPVADFEKWIGKVLAVDVTEGTVLKAEHFQ